MGRLNELPPLPAILRNVVGGGPREWSFSSLIIIPDTTQFAGPPPSTARRLVLF